jgi:hypothetical protein
MPLEAEHEALKLLATQRCFYLFAALLLLLITIPFLEDSPRGLVTLNFINALVLIAALAAVARSHICLVIGVLLAAPAIVFQILSFIGYEPRYLALSRAFGAGLYFITVGYLLGYVLRRETFTTDKLYGAAAAFLMLGVLWSYFYALVLSFYPGALSVGGTPIKESAVSEMVYFSFTVLTSTGFGDVAPISRQARSLCVVEQVVGVLFLAILIARLAGVYPRNRGLQN